jgi:hypothetical protein
MSFEEKRTWILGLVSIVSYSIYATIILGRAENAPLTHVSYVPTMLWTIGASIAASILLSILVAIASPKEANKKDPRDREINRLGDTIGLSFVVLGGVAAMGMAMAKMDYFWISNALFLSFSLSSVTGSVAKVVAHRRGFQSW